MSDKKDQKPNDAQPPGLMRATVEEAQAALQTNSQICGRLEDALDDALRKFCQSKSFEQSFGNCDQRCEGVPEPKIVPCLHLRWGDGPQDHLETDDTEVLCITVCNPYFNVILKDFTLQLEVLTAGGAVVPNQPNGTPSVMIKPQFNICFGDIEPCKLELSNPKSCVSREVVLINRGAIAGQYKVHIAYCFEACFTKFVNEPAAFVLDLVAS